MAITKAIHTAVLDTGVIIKNEPSISTLLSRTEALVTVPAILSEIRDAATRSRVDTTVRPFLTIRSPTPNSLKFVKDFARKTGDLSVLSLPDLQIIALAYELECERNGGDWRLRRTPGQQGLNGPVPPKKDQQAAECSVGDSTENRGVQDVPAESKHDEHSDQSQTADTADHCQDPTLTNLSSSHNEDDSSTPPADDLAEDLQSLQVTSNEADQHLDPASKVGSARPSAESQSDESASDSEGWITPSNLKKKQAEDAGASATQASTATTMQVAVLTTDFAMQNVILQMGLNLVSPALARVRRVKTHVLRCHACFAVCRDAAKQFCPRCGGPTLTRVACSTSAGGQLQLHLKKNMQWNHRGDRYSIPKPAHGSANGRTAGGGKGGWGHALILAEDQKEYQSAVQAEKRQKQRNPMDDDYLPAILTGDRGKAGGRIRVGAGRNVNSRKR